MAITMPPKHISLPWTTIHTMLEKTIVQRLIDDGMSPFDARKAYNASSETHDHTVVNFVSESIGKGVYVDVRVGDQKQSYQVVHTTYPRKKTKDAGYYKSLSRARDNLAIIRDYANWEERLLNITGYLLGQNPINHTVPAKMVEAVERLRYHILGSAGKVWSEAFVDLLNELPKESLSNLFKWCRSAIPLMGTMPHKFTQFSNTELLNILAAHKDEHVSKLRIVIGAKIPPTECDVVSMILAVKSPKVNVPGLHAYSKEHKLEEALAMSDVGMYIEGDVLRRVARYHAKLRDMGMFVYAPAEYRAASIWPTIEDKQELVVYRSTCSMARGVITVHPDMLELSHWIDNEQVKDKHELFIKTIDFAISEAHKLKINKIQVTVPYGMGVDYRNTRGVQITFVSEDECVRRAMEGKE